MYNLILSVGQYNRWVAESPARSSQCPWMFPLMGHTPTIQQADGLIWIDAFKTEHGLTGIGTAVALSMGMAQN